MHKKLHISLIFCNLVVSKSLSTHIIVMHNFVTKFRKILEICKQFAGNLVNEKGNVPRCGVVPIFSDIEVSRPTDSLPESMQRLRHSRSYSISTFSIIELLDKANMHYFNSTNGYYI